MKNFFKLVAVLTALAAAGFGLAACSDDDDDDRDYRVSVSSADVLATFEGTNDFGNFYYFYFYSDGKWKIDSAEFYTDGTNIYRTQWSGTYTGDVSQDGTIHVDIKKQYDEGVASDYEYGGYDITISDGKIEHFRVRSTFVTFERK